MFVASLTRRFVSAKRLFRDLSEFVGKLVEHHAQSPVRKFKMFLFLFFFSDVVYLVTQHLLEKKIASAAITSLQKSPRCEHDLKLNMKNPWRCDLLSWSSARTTKNEIDQCPGDTARRRVLISRRVVFATLY